MNIFPWRRVKTLPPPYTETTNQGFSQPVYLVKPNNKRYLAEEIGDLLSNSIVAACVSYYIRKISETPLYVQNNRNGTPISSHPLTSLLKYPNPDISGNELWRMTITDLLPTGNAYWLKVRNGNKTVTQIYPICSKIMQPKVNPNSGEWISYYQRSDGRKYDPEDIVHFRINTNPNTREGVSMFYPVYKEIDADNQALSYHSSILNNMGAISAIVNMGNTKATQEQMDLFKENIQERITGARSGGVLVTKGDTTVTPLAFSPEQMALDKIKDSPEERIPAVCGLNAVVLGLGAGLDHSTYNNMSEAREAAYEGGIIPLQCNLKDTLQSSLLSELGNTNLEELVWDRSEVQELQQDITDLSKRVISLVEGGIISIEEARAEMGYEKQIPKNEGVG